MTAPDLSGATWIKSSRSAEDNNCIELSLGGDLAGVRDSKSSSGPTLALPAGGLRAFIDAVKCHQL